MAEGMASQKQYWGGSSDTAPFHIYILSLSACFRKEFWYFFGATGIAPGSPALARTQQQKTKRCVKRRGFKQSGRVGYLDKEEKEGGHHFASICNHQRT
jgi:hypothetical protein